MTPEMSALSCSGKRRKCSGKNCPLFKIETSKEAKFALTTECPILLSGDKKPLHLWNEKENYWYQNSLFLFGEFLQPSLALTE
jgi:hypothetical protein